MADHGTVTVTRRPTLTVTSPPPGGRVTVTSADRGVLTAESTRPRVVTSRDRVASVAAVAAQGPAGVPGPRGDDGIPGPAGPAGPASPGATFVWDQSAPAAVWTITHNLHQRPSVTVVDSAGSKVNGRVRYVSDDVIEVTFTVTFGGKAYLN